MSQAVTRLDPHRPSAIEPEEYKFVAFECLKIEDFGDAIFLRTERERIRAHMARTGGTYSHHQHGGNCHVCGASAVYTALFYHATTNSYVRTGLTCADKLDYCDVDAFRRQIRTALEQVAGKRKAKAVLETQGLIGAWEIYLNFGEGERREEPTVRDIVGRLVKYGSLSDAQIGYLGKLVAKIGSRAEDDAKRAIEREAAEPVPTIAGRTTVSGTVVTVKTVDLDGYIQSQMLVRCELGYKLWGTRPRSLEDVKAGDMVRFDATVKPSKNDEKFGYFSRPTKAVVVEPTP